MSVKAPQYGRDDKVATSHGIARRDLLKAPLALAAGSLVLPFLDRASKAQAAEKSGVSIEPRYYPRSHFKPQIDLEGKLAVITGASRGIGRAIGETLAALGVDVLGTSRNPAGVPDPPAFPLLTLDIADPVSVFGFIGELTTHPMFLEHGQVDILANNAGRMVAGRIVPVAPGVFLDYLAQRDLGMRTLYSGHVTVTNALLPLMAHVGYSRIIFTGSIDAYVNFSLFAGGAGSLMDVYSSAKVALRGYANNLDGALRAAGSSTRVSTVNPYIVNTALLTHPNPIYTQPVDPDTGLTGDPVFDEAFAWLASLLANGLPASMVGETFAQLLTMNEPDQNVVVASPHGRLAEQGGNYLIEPEILAENELSALPFTCD
jgi:NAD(P)-dependent dehydrogenase (short-subunit alcohol dehydrogenase family)